ncbi:MAG: murein L,D-transpeptidase YafK [Bacteroidia bacterium]|jgi:murein L,D-transpeptidase YafK
MNPLNKIARISCKQAAMLGAKASFNALTVFEKMKLKMHVKVCVACQTYKANSELIDEAVAKILEQKEKQELSLSAEQRKNILQAIQ